MKSKLIAALISTIAISGAAYSIINNSSENVDINKKTNINTYDKTDSSKELLQDEKIVNHEISDVSNSKDIVLESTKENQSVNNTDESKNDKETSIEKEENNQNTSINKPNIDKNDGQDTPNMDESEGQDIPNKDEEEPSDNKPVIAQEKVNNVITLINNIPENITVENLQEAKEAVQKAEDAFNALPEESQKGIPSTTLSILTFSKEHIQRLEDSIKNENNPQVLAIQDKIDKLPELTDADINNYDKVKSVDEEVNAVLKEFNSLPVELRNAVKNQDKLMESYEKTRYVKAKIIQKEIDKININEIKISDKNKIYGLQEAYNNLDRVGQLLVENNMKLRQAVDKLNQLISSSENTESVNEQKVNNVINLISTLSETITYDDEKAVEEATTHYENLNTDEKALVHNYDKLQSAQITMDDLKNQIHNVYNLIGMIPEDINENNIGTAYERVVIARQAYDELPEASRKGISASTYSILVSSEQEVKRVAESIQHQNDKDVKEVIEMIDKLNGVDTLKPVEADYEKIGQLQVYINQITDKFNNLGIEKQSAVTNEEKFREAYDRLNYLNAKVIENEISKLDINNLTDDDKGRVQALNKAYRGLNRVGQLLVTNYQDLRKACHILSINPDAIIERM